MPYIKLKCNRCNHIFHQNVERCDELYKNDLCKSADFSTLEHDEIAVKKEKIEAIIKDLKDGCYKDMPRHIYKEIICNAIFDLEELLK